LIDELSFEEFYRQTAAPLRAYVVRVIGHTAPAEDIVQDAYLGCSARRPRSIPASWRAYLFRVASISFTTTGGCSAASVTHSIAMPAAWQTVSPNRR
jgi:hypothetical protein